MMCRHCRRYAAQMAAIGAAARDLLRQDPGPPRELEEAVLKRCLDGGRDPDA